MLLMLCRSVGKAIDNREEMSYCLQIALDARQTSFSFSMHVLSSAATRHLLTISGAPSFFPNLSNIPYSTPYDHRHPHDFGAS